MGVLYNSLLYTKQWEENYVALSSWIAKHMMSLQNRGNSSACPEETETLFFFFFLKYKDFAIFLIISFLVLNVPMTFSLNDILRFSLLLPATVAENNRG